MAVTAAESFEEFDAKRMVVSALSQSIAGKAGLDDGAWNRRKGKGSPGRSEGNPVCDPEQTDQLQRVNNEIERRIKENFRLGCRAFQCSVLAELRTRALKRNVREIELEVGEIHAQTATAANELEKAWEHMSTVRRTLPFH